MSSNIKNVVKKYQREARSVSGGTAKVQLEFEVEIDEDKSVTTDEIQRFYEQSGFGELLETAPEVWAGGDVVGSGVARTLKVRVK